MELLTVPWIMLLNGSILFSLVTLQCTILFNGPILFSFGPCILFPLCLFMIIIFFTMHFGHHQYIYNVCNLYMLKYLTEWNCIKTTRYINVESKAPNYGHQLLSDKLSTKTFQYVKRNPIFMMMEIIKKHPNYKMLQQHERITTAELIALIVYTYSRGYCEKMKQSRNNWYYCASNAVDKIHSVFHYKKNDESQPKMLFHGTSNPSFDQFSKQELFFKTFCSFTTEFSVAQKFATGSILVITEVDERLRSGQLKGADVSWISTYDEHEWIILPTTFRSWREMSKHEIIDYGWNISDDRKVYITNDYETKINVLTQFGGFKPFYHNLQCDTPLVNVDKTIKNWFDNQLSFRSIDSVKYFGLFIENGYDTFDLIKQIKCVEDLNSIGIIKIAHVNHMLQKIAALNKYLNGKHSEPNVEQLYQIMKDVDEYNDGYLCYRRVKNRVICESECEWIHHDTIPINQFAPISSKDLTHIAKFHPDLHHRLNNK